MEEGLIIAFRTLGLFVLLLLLFPLLGRKPMSGMTAFDYVSGLVVGLMIALIALNVVTNLAFGLLGLFLWFVAILIVQYLIQKSKWAHDHMYGKEKVIIKEGKVLEENLHSAKLTGEELLSQLRRRNIFQVADVEFAVMEANGDLTTLLKRDKQPITPMDMNIVVNPMKEPQTVILDGNIMDEPLTTLGLNRDWLFDQLNQMGISTENIFIGQVDSMGELYVDTFDDALQLPKQTTKQLLLSTLQKAEADFMQYGLETKQQEWKKRYEYYATSMNKLIKRIEPYLIN